MKTIEQRLSTAPTLDGELEASRGRISQDKKSLGICAGRKLMRILKRADLVLPQRRDEFGTSQTGDFRRPALREQL